MLRKMTTTSETVVCVGSVVRKSNTVLAVRQAKGHTLEGQWTIPWGRLEQGESPSRAAVREVQEEAGIDVTVQGLAGLQEMPAPWAGWIALVFQCAYVGGEPRPDQRETDAAKFLSLNDLNTMRESVEPWSLWLMQRVLTQKQRAIAVHDSSPYRPSRSFL